MDRSRVCHILTPPTPAPTSSLSPPPLPVKVVDDDDDDDAECLINFFRGGIFRFTPKICVCVVAVHLFPGEWAGDCTASLVNIS